MILHRVDGFPERVAQGFPGSAWLLMQAVTGYALMTGEAPDPAPMKNVFL